MAINDPRKASVSVVIPAFNAEKRIVEAIESVLNQSFPVNEVIVVNDGSSDRTDELCRGFGDRIVYIDQPNQGVSATRNRGINTATSDWVAFLDADDTWMPERIESQFEVIKRFPDVAWVAGRYLRCTPGRDYDSKFGFDGVTEKHVVLDALEALANQTAIWTGTLLAKRNEFLSLDGFDGSLKGCEDYDLWVRMAIRNRRIGFVNAPIARYTVDQANSLTGQSAAKFNDTLLRFFEKRLHESESGESADVRRWCKAILDEQIGSYLFNMLRVGNRDGAKKLLGWLSENRLPKPALKYRWPMWVPSSLVRHARTLWKRARSRGLASRST